MVTVAEALPGEPWWNILINGGIATGVIGWFMWRDSLDRKERKENQVDQERRHNENLAAQKRIEDAFRTTTTSLIVGMGAMKSLDANYLELLSKVNGAMQNDAGR